MFAMFFLGGGEVLLLSFLVFFLPLSLLFTAFWIWMLVDAAKNPGLDQNERVVWIIVVALLHWIGAAIYFFFGRPKRRLAPVA
jgi:hypothetical protein